MLEEQKKEVMTKNERLEARQNLSGFFNLLFEIALRKKIDIGQYENNRDSNTADKT